MPDWSYRTLLKPLLFGLPPDRSRRLVVGCFDSLARIPQGVRLVDLLGHMQPDPSLSLELSGIPACSPVGLAPIIDPRGRAIEALSRFGVGWLTIGPVTLSSPAVGATFARTPDGSGILRHGHASLSLDDALRIETPDAKGPRLAVELQPETLEEAIRLVEELAPVADLYLLSPVARDGPSPPWHEQLSVVVEKAREVGRPIFFGVPNDGSLTKEEVEHLQDLDVDGLYLSGRPASHNKGTWRWHQDDVATALSTLEVVEDSRAELAIIVEAGAVSPRDVLALMEAGADLVSVAVGLVHTGPGLAKRANEALEYQARCSESEEVRTEVRPAEQRAWFWGAALGLSMGIGALLAVVISLTDILLPYDLLFLGQTSSAIESFNPRILHFMTHDRLTLAGTMVSLAVIYSSLSLFAIRLGHHWAQRALTVSAAIGFLSFFSFLGFGYLDPFHAFVSAILFVLFVQAVAQPLGTNRRNLKAPHLDNDRVWKLAQWGQLCFVIQAVGLLLGGATILTVGMTRVFVDTDLGFLGMSSADLQRFDPQLIPLIAHDRATFGGMLLAGGMALLLTTLWSHRAGDRWLWWTYLLVILPPYVMTLWIHHRIGYTSQFHLSPVYIGLSLMLAGLVLSGPWLLRLGDHQTENHRSLQQLQRRK